ncbi:hypothetical protein [Clostridium sp.]|uniref:hypothetical protein n=1 Tax=Clostridium sp. TaxID=1506 RepID=UPI0028484B13|nr:hypothetical protein [Clostridium sp.]MDR3594606.1 hypothetical protein [Clostridium sp.]
MATRKQNKIPKSDFDAEDDLDVCGFTSEPIVTGECISSFSFDDNSINEIKLDATTNTGNSSDVDTSSNITNDTVNFTIDPDNEQTINSPTTSNNISMSNSNDTTRSNNQITLNKNTTLEDNRKAPVVNGMAPPINGEYLDIKRTYMLRASTVRKINQLKSIHPELNTYVSTIVDLAIAHYYDYIINGGSQ